MKSIFIQVCKKPVFSELIQNPVYNFYVGQTRVFGINHDVVQICNDENLEFFSKDFVNIVLEAELSIRKTKKHDLILEMTIPDSKNGLLFIAFLNFHLMVGTN